MDVRQIQIWKRRFLGTRYSCQTEPVPDKRCRLNRSMQHLVTTCSDNTSFRESTSTVVLNQNLNRAFVLFELTPGNEIGLPGSYKKTLCKCCNDLLRPPGLSESENPARKDRKPH